MEQQPSEDLVKLPVVGMNRVQQVGKPEHNTAPPYNKGLTLKMLSYSLVSGYLGRSGT